MAGTHISFFEHLYIEPDSGHRFDRLSMGEDRQERRLTTGVGMKSKSKGDEN